MIISVKYHMILHLEIMRGALPRHCVETHPLSRGRKSGWQLCRERANGQSHRGAVFILWGFTHLIKINANKVKTAWTVQETSSAALAQTTSRCEDFPPLPNLEGERLAIFFQRVMASPTSPTRFHSKAKWKDYYFIA